MLIRVSFDLWLIWDFFQIVAEHRLSANPELVGITSLELFDKTVEVLTETAGLMVILNNHVITHLFRPITKE